MKKPGKVIKSSDILKLEEQLTKTLGTSVKVEDKIGKGNLMIDHQNLDIVDGILRTTNSRCFSTGFVITISESVEKSLARGQTF